MKIIMAALALLSLAACDTLPAKTDNAKTVASAALPSTIKEAVDSSYRRQENKARDPYRHPLQTLEFFGVKPDMTVVEISPARGWYSEILAPYLVAHGHYIAAISGPAHENTLGDWLKLHPEVAAKVTSTNFDPSKKTDVAPAGTADRVLTFRNVHNWMAKGVAQNAFDAFFRALKPGGILGVVEHRAKAHGHHDLKAKSGYVRESDVIKMAEKAGFKLLAKSEINANPKDTTLHPKGVWTLPPTLRLKDKDRAKYLAIGESDRMTLTFEKPAGKQEAKK
jgi:predicted methyltransferase